MFAPLLALALTPSPTLQVRIAVGDVTPPEPLALGGYTERQGKLADPGGSRLFARALALQGGVQRVVIVSLETLTIPESLVREVRARLPDDAKLFLAATHTHCAPDSQMLNDRMTFAVPGIATYKRRWLQWMAEKVASVAKAALRAKPVTSGALVLELAHVDRTRSRRATDYPDQTMARLRLGSAPGTMLLTHFAAHPVFRDAAWNRLDGDWPGEMAGSTGGVALLGSIGDVSPIMDGRPSTDQIASFVQACLAAKGTALSLEPKLDWKEERVALGPKTPHPGFGREFGVPAALAKLAVNQFAPDAAAISVFRIGKLAVVGVPGEPTSALGRRIRDAGCRLGFASVLVTSLVNGWIGYILEPADYDEGGYEAALAMHGREAGDRVYEAALRALKELAGPVGPPRTPFLRSPESVPRSAR